MLKLDVKNRNKAWLMDNYFHYDPKRSNDGESMYVYSFPVWRSGDFITLEAKISVILETGKVQTDVYDTSFKGRYAPYYMKPSYYEPLLDKIRVKIEDKYKTFGIREEDE